MAIISGKNISLEYGAISLDTEVFEKNGFRFDKGMLRQLNQFKKGKFKFLISEVVHKEIHSHLREKIAGFLDKVNDFQVQSGRHFFSDDVPFDGFNLSFQKISDKEAYIEKKLSDFYEESGVIKVPVEKYVDINRVVDMYFSVQAPFEDRKDKKNEFPDAIALLSLERWAQVHNTKVIAVSGDDGWKDFCDGSDWLVHVKDLAEALNMFVPHELLKEIARYILEENVILRSELVDQDLQNEIESVVACSTPIIYAATNFPALCKNISLEYQGHRFIRDADDNVDFKIVRIVDGEVIVSVEAIVSFRIEMSLIFNSIDEIYGDSEGQPYVSDEEYVAEILLHVSGDFKGGVRTLNVTKFEILNDVESVDFGYVGGVELFGHSSL